MVQPKVLVQNTDKVKKTIQININYIESIKALFCPDFASMPIGAAYEQAGGSHDAATYLDMPALQSLTTPCIIDAHHTHPGPTSDPTQVAH